LRFLLIFVASSETAGGVDGVVNATRLCVERYLAPLLDKSPLLNLDMKLRYIPIVMPEENQKRYPERSKARIDQRIYDCAPHLNFEIFSVGSWELQLTEYIRGLSLSLPHLHKFGATSLQVQAFRLILSAAVGEITRTISGPDLVFYDNGRRVMDASDTFMNQQTEDLLKILGFKA